MAFIRENFSGFQFDGVPAIKFSMEQKSACSGIDSKNLTVVRNHEKMSIIIFIKIALYGKTGSCG